RSQAPDTPSVEHPSQRTPTPAETDDRSAAALARAVDRIAANVPGVVYQVRIDAEGQVSYPYVSEGIRAVVGIEPQTLRDDPGILARMVHPEDLEAFVRDLGRRLRDPGVAQWEGRLVLADGSVRWVALHSQPQPAGEDGSVVRDGVALDIT